MSIMMIVYYIACVCVCVCHLLLYIHGPHNGRKLSCTVPNYICTFVGLDDGFL